MHSASASFDHADIRDNYKIAYTFPNAPEASRGGLILPAENGSYQVVLIGRGEDIPPISESEFRRYARELWTPTLYNAIKNAKLLTEITPIRLPKVDGDISRKSLTFLADCCQLGMPFAVLTRSTAKACPSQHGRPVCFLIYWEDSTVICCRHWRTNF